MREHSQIMITAISPLYAGICAFLPLRVGGDGKSLHFHPLISRNHGGRSLSSARNIL